MTFKIYLASFTACFWVMNTIAQKKQNIYFLKDNGKYVSTKDSAEFVRIIREPDSASVLYNLLDYYLNGKLKMVGKTAEIKPIKLEGTTISYYPNGNRKQVATYTDGIYTGIIYDYYPNSKLYRSSSRQMVPVYGKGNNVYDKQINSVDDTTVLQIFHPIGISTETVYNVFDSTGIQTVKDGNGHYRVFNQENKTFESEGDLKEGKKIGSWKSIISQGNFITSEQYDENGNFTKGTCAIANGSAVKYNEIDLMPSPRGISKSFSAEFYKYVNAPAYKKQTDKGLLYVSLIIEKDGSFTHVKVFKKTSSDLDFEAARLIKESPKWNPGLQHGVPVRVNNNLFISLDY
ncbi:MAG: hypothetical protein EOP43_02425 [Sphingobacteriaceae bacterium]|nr:MAG: hypothetical protein EOP43_02425 [Sphingobacteriaceae bacterium]